MHLDQKILGKTAFDVLRARESSAVLVIGRDRFSRKDLAAVACFNFGAAAILTSILSHQLKAKDTKDVFERVHPRALAIPGLGHISFATLGAAFEKMGLGTLTDYYDRHLQDVRHVTFGAFKHTQQLVEERDKRLARAKRRRGSAPQRGRATRRNGGNGNGAHGAQF